MKIRLRDLSTPWRLETYQLLSEALVKAKAQEDVFAVVVLRRLPTGIAGRTWSHGFVRYIELESDRPLSAEFETWAHETCHAILKQGKLPSIEALRKSDAKDKEAVKSATWAEEHGREPDEEEVAAMLPGLLEELSKYIDWT